MVTAVEARRLSRGTAAVEFALCVPVLLMLLAGTIYFGLAVLSRVELDNIASSATRSCVLQQWGTTGAGAYETCASSTFDTLIKQYPHICDNGAPQVTTDSTTRLDTSIPATTTLAQIRLLTLKVTCQKRISPIVNGANNYKGSTVPGYITVTAGAGMPFVLATRNR